MDAHDTTTTIPADDEDVLDRLAGRFADGQHDRAVAEATLWLAALLALAADVHTTYVGIQVGLTEGNPLARSAMDLAGVGGLLGLKTIALVLAAGLRVHAPRYWLVIPLGLSVPWTAAALANLHTLA